MRIQTIRQASDTVIICGENSVVHYVYYEDGLLNLIAGVTVVHHTCGSKEPPDKKMF
jgi:hypothetical protein